MSEEYPKTPVGLRWDEHYLMADQVAYAYRHGRATPPRTQPEEHKARPIEQRHFPHKRAGKRIA